MWDEKACLWPQFSQIYPHWLLTFRKHSFNFQVLHWLRKMLWLVSWPMCWDLAIGSGQDRWVLVPKMCSRFKAEQTKPQGPFCWWLRSDQKTREIALGKWYTQLYSNHNKRSFITTIPIFFFRPTETVFHFTIRWTLMMFPTITK